MATSGPSPEDSEHFFRLVSLLLDCGTNVLRKVFTQKALAHHTDIGAFLAYHKTTLERLCNNRHILNQTQLDQLFPINGTMADIATFDITLLSCLLLNVCTLTKQEETDVVQLRNLRNEVSGHSPEASVDENDFNIYWNQIRIVLMNLAQSTNDSSFVKRVQDDIKNITVDPKYVRLTARVLQKLLADDRELSQKLSALSESQNQNKTEICQKIDDVNQEVKTIDKKLNTLPVDPVLQNLIKKTEEMAKQKREQHYIYTSQFKEAEKLLDQHGSVVVSGLPGEGKSTLSLILMSCSTKTRNCVILSNSQDWNHVDIETVETVFIEDIFGVYKFDEGKLLSWYHVLEQLNKLVRTKKMKMIITSRSEVLAECQSRIRRFDTLQNKLELSSSQLTMEEKESILLSCLKQTGKSLEKDKLLLCVEAFKADIGFPYCCQMFAMDLNLFKLGHTFFKKPYRYFIDNLAVMDKAKLATLVLVYYNKGFLLETSVAEQIDLYQDIKMKLGDQTAMTVDTIDRSLQELSGIYLEKQDGFIHFSHSIVYEAIGILYGKYSQNEVIRTCSVDFLCQCLNTNPRKGTDVLEVSRSNYDILADRFLCEVISNGNVEHMASHPALLHERFAKCVWAKVERGGAIDKFLGQSRPAEKSFLSCIAKCESPEIKPFLRKCISKLSCAEENVHQAGCWKCKHKRQALLNGCRQGQTFSVKILLKELLSECQWNPNGPDASIALEEAYNRGIVEMITVLENTGVRVTHCCVYKAVWSANPVAVEHAVKQLKKTAKWNPQHPDVVTALEDAYNRGLLEIISILEAECVKVTRACMKKAVYSNKPLVVKRAIESLKRSRQWCSEHGDTIQALNVAYKAGNMNVIKMLEEAGAETRPICFLMATESQDYDVVTHATQQLKSLRLWNCGDQEMVKALIFAYRYCEEDLIDEFLQEGIPVTHECLVEAVESGEISRVKHAIQQLKDVDTWNPEHAPISGILQTAYGLSQFDTVHLLEAEGALTTHDCLYAAVNSGNEAAIEHCIDQLKTSKTWNPKDDTIQKALCGEYTKGNKSTIQLLEKAGVVPVLRCLSEALCSSQPSVIRHAVGQLQQSKQWDPKHQTVVQVLQEAYRKGDHNIVELLEKAGANVTKRCFYEAMDSGKAQLVTHVIKRLKDSRQWDSTSKEVVSLLEEYYNGGDLNIIIALEEGGVRTTQRCFSQATRDENPYYLEHAIEQLQVLKTWNPKNEDAYLALKVSYNKGNLQQIRALEDGGVVAPPKCVYWAVGSGSTDVVSNAIQHLKDTQQWSQGNEFVAKALKYSYSEGKLDMVKTIEQSGVPTNPTHVHSAVRSGKPAILNHVIQRLKESGDWNPSHQDIVSAIQVAELTDKLDLMKILNKAGGTQYQSGNSCVMC